MTPRPLARARERTFWKRPPMSGWAERQALRCLAALDALSGLQWGTANADGEVTGRARRTLEILVSMPGGTN
jgi:hypothetical protein